jgi:hypothetical protein
MLKASAGETLADYPQVSQRDFILHICLTPS